MSLPLPANSKWKCLPEIHASRLSVSGSLRPKLGLLLLCIVILVSLCFILVPVISKLQVTTNTRTLSSHPLPLSELLTRVSLGSGRPVILSPSILLASLALVNVSRPSLAPPQCAPRPHHTPGTSSTVNISAVVVIKKGRQRPSACSGENITVIEAEAGSGEAAAQERVTVTSHVRLEVPGTAAGEQLVVAGMFQLLQRPDYTLVQLQLEAGLQLVLVQPRSAALPRLSLDMLDPAPAPSSVTLVLPARALQSSLALAPHLRAAGISLPDNIPVYHEASLQFLPQVDIVFVVFCLGSSHKIIGSHGTPHYVYLSQVHNSTFKTDVFLQRCRVKVFEAFLQENSKMLKCCPRS